MVAKPAHIDGGIFYMVLTDVPDLVGVCVGACRRGLKS